MKSLQNLSYKTLFTILFFSLAGIVFFLKIGGKTQKVSAAWWDDMWHYRKAISITNSSGSNLTDFQVAVSIGTSQLIADGKMQTDCDDIRLTDINGNLLPYWVEPNGQNSCNQITDTRIWVKVSSLPISGAAIYLYYGNNTTTGASSLNSVSTPTTVVSNILTSGGINQNLTWNNIQLRGKVLVFGSLERAGGCGGTTRYDEITISGVGTTWYASDGGGYCETADGFISGSARQLIQDIVDFNTGEYSINWKTDGSAVSDGKDKTLTNKGNYDGKGGIEIIRLFKYASSDPASTLQSEETGGGPIAYWKFDEGSGSTAYDSIGTNNGTITGTTWQNEENCFSGKCLFFNGTTSDYVNTNFGNGKDMSSPLSISMWVKPASPAANKMFLGSSNGTNQRFYFATYNGKWSMGIQGSGWDTQGTDVTLGQWHHVEITMDGSTAKMFINNKLIRQKSYTPYNLASNILIGWGTGSDYYWNGYIDDVKIYPYVRTADQIKLDYNSRGSLSGSGVNMGNQDTSSIFMSSGLVGYWKMEEGIGNTTLDSSGNNNTATFSTGSSAPSWVNSKYGIGISFNTGGYLSIGTSISGTVWSLNTQIKYLNKSRNFEFFAGNNANTTTGKLLLRHNGYIAFYGSNGTYYDFSTQSTDIQDSSKNISFVSNGTTISLYVDGVFKSSVTPASTSISINQINNGWTDAVWTAAGVIDEVRIYNRALSAIEVNQLYQNFTKGGTNIRNSLMAYYKFDENNGTTVYDSSGNNINGNFGTGNSAPTWTSGKINKSLSFDGNDDYLIFSDNDNLDTPNDYTISMWVYNQAGSKSWPTLLNRASASTSNGYFWIYTTGTNESDLNFQYSNGAYQTVTFSNALNLNTWNHISFTFNNSTKELQLFVDGKKFSTSRTLTNPLPVDDGNLYIGTYQGNPASYPFQGLIDEVKIYNKALTADEIKQDYNQGSAISFGQTTQNIGGTTTSLDYCIPGDTSYCAAPVAEYKLDEGAGTSSIDTSGNNLDVGFSGSPTWIQGKIGKALSFNGTTDFLNNTRKSLPNGLTFGTWIKTTSTDSSVVYAGNAAQNIIGDSNGGSVSFGFGIHGGKVRYTQYASSWQNIIGNISVNDGLWHYINVTHNQSTGNIAIYVDGKQDVTGNIAYNGSNRFDLIARGYGGDYFTGQLDQIRIYNYARTPAQIAYDYNKGGPVGWWKFDECQGNIAYDWSGIGNTGVISIGSGGSQNSLGTCAVGTSAAWTNGSTGKTNSSLNFDGTDDYINVGDPSNGSLDFGVNDFTTVAWFKTTSSISSIILGKYNAYPLFYTRLNGSGIIESRIGFDSSTNFTNTSGIAVNDGNWHQIVTTHKRNGNMTKYIDGKIYGSPLDISSVSTRTIDTSNVFRIGSDSASTPSNFFNGQIDDVRIYNYALTSEQVKQIYNGGSVNFN